MGRRKAPEEEPKMIERNRNAYCEKLGIAVPRPEELLRQPKPKLFELVVIALLEHGGPGIRR